MVASDETPPAVRLDGITKEFRSVVANDAIDLTLESGEIHALLGENGSGKTTLMSVLYGLYQQDAGEIIIDGTPREITGTDDAIEAGVGMIHQHFQLVEPMTVLQNIVLGHEPTRAGLVDTATARERIAELCDRYGFAVDERLDTPVADLELGDRQRVEIVKSLYRGAEILILDEPTAVLTPQEASNLFALMRDLADDGASLIFITHKLEEAMEVADRITVLRDGTNVGTVPADESSKSELARLMVGREVLFDYDDQRSAPGETTLSVTGLGVRDDQRTIDVTDVDFEVRAGEIFGVAGIEGNGQSPLIAALTGIRSPDAGEIAFDDTDVTTASRRETIAAGMAFIPEDRHEDGLVLEYDLVRNGLLGFQADEAFSDFGFLDWDAVDEHAAEIIREYDVRPPDAEKRATSLSGGNQQKFVVGRELSHDPDLLIASHPTRGVDVGSIEFIHNELLEMRDAGMAIVLVSSKLREIQKLSDRIGVMYDGEFVDTVEPADVTDEQLGLLMTGTDPETVSTTEPPVNPQGGSRE